MTNGSRPEVDYSVFAHQWAKAVSEAATNPMALMLMNLNVKVKCRSCGVLVNGEDTVKGTELYCPRCGAGVKIKAWRIVGTQSAIDSAYAFGLYARMKELNRLPNFGSVNDGYEGRGPDGRSIVALFF